MCLLLYTSLIYWQLYVHCAIASGGHEGKNVSDFWSDPLFIQCRPLLFYYAITGIYLKIKWIHSIVDCSPWNNKSKMCTALYTLILIICLEQVTIWFKLCITCPHILIVNDYCSPCLLCIIISLLIIFIASLIILGSEWM